MPHVPAGGFSGSGELAAPRYVIDEAGNLLYEYDSAYIENRCEGRAVVQRSWGPVSNSPVGIFTVGPCGAVGALTKCSVCVIVYPGVLSSGTCCVCNQVGRG